MTGAELDALIEGLAPAVKEFVASSLDEMAGRVKTLEARAPEPGPSGPVGEKGEPGAPGKDGRDGQDAALDVDVIREMVDRLWRESVASLPVPVNGRDGVDGKDADPQVVAALTFDLAQARMEVDRLKLVIADTQAQYQQLAARLDAWPVPSDGKDGKDADPVVVEQLVTDSVTKALAEWPKPVDGASVTVEDVAPIIAAEVTKAVSALPKAKDGIGLTGALINRSGDLVVTLSDGTAQNVGMVVGKDADMDALCAAIVAEVAKMPPPANGKDGADGRDGTLENLTIAYDGERTVTFCFKNGDPIEGGVLKMPVAIYRGLFTEGKAYEPGDLVTWGGSMWHAKEATIAKPEESRAWTLAVKRGRDGKTGPEGKSGPQGPRGDSGSVHQR